MMNMDVMRRIVAEAETGDKAMRTAHAALAHWDFDTSTLKDWRYSANAIYGFKQRGVTRVLRLAIAGDGIRARSREDIEAELDFIRYLDTQGISAMLPVPSSSGECVHVVESPYAQFYATVFEKAPGDLFLEQDKLTEAQIIAWGEIVAKTHKASENYAPSAGRRRPAWEAIIAMVDAWLPPEEYDARRFLREAEAWLRSLPTTPDDYGLIHWDFCIDNLAWDKSDGHPGRYHIFDFDDAAYFWYVADIAFAIENFFEMPAAQCDALLDAFLTGYRAVRPAIEPWIDEIPRFVRFMHIFKVARVMHALAPADPALDPPWMAELRAKFENRFDEMRVLFAQPFI